MSTVHVGHATYHLDVTLVKQNAANNSSDVNVHAYAVADSGWGGSFASGIPWSGSFAASGSFNINGGSTVEIANYTVTVAHNAQGNFSQTVTLHVNDTGTETYAGPVDLAQPFTAPRIPKPPQAPTVTAVAKPGLVVDVTVSFGSGYDDGGATVTSVTTQYSKNGGAWTGNKSGAWGTRTYTGLTPGSYVFRAWATNSRGNSQYGVATAVTVLAGGYVWNGTSWVASLGVYVWNGTAWVICQGVYTWNGTAWTPAL